MHHGTDQQAVVGVLCIGAPQIRPRDPKLMFQLVTNLSTLALSNASNVKRLKSMANTDGLTGLLNKRAFTEDRARQLMVQCERQARPFAVFIFDLDNFKNYNDTNGHPAGDDLLRRMGQLITELLRPTDLACRYGGEEFVVAMPGTDREQALEQAERIRAAVANGTFEHMHLQPLGHISISGGVAAFPKDGQSVSELIRRADEALYQSKKGGRNRVSAYRAVEIGASEVQVEAAAAAVEADAELGVVRG
jgi:diguanylate cyclase (GGDEF)-like protein